MGTTSAHQLREPGLRVTRSRLPLLSAPADHPRADADSSVGARQEHPSLSSRAVCGVEEAFVTAGIARRIEPAGVPALFEVRVGGDHHLVCRSGGAVADVDCAVGAAPCPSPWDTAGFVVDQAEIVWWGLCSNCRTGGRQVAGGAAPAQVGQHHNRGGAGA